MANKRVKIDVTEDDYQNALRECSANTAYSRARHCLITTAVQRYIPSLRSCGNNCLFIPGHERVMLPKKVQDAIANFDKNLPFEPLSFIVSVPEELLSV